MVKNIEELRFHPTLWPTAINDEIARGVYARTGLAENVDQMVCLGGRTLIGTKLRNDKLENYETNYVKPVTPWTSRPK